MAARDIIVVGAGVIGSAVAFALARMGARVLLIERDRVGAHASAASAGMLTPIVEAESAEDVDPLALEALEILPALVEELRELSGIDPELSRCGVLRVAGAEDATDLRARAARLSKLDCEWLDTRAVREVEPRLAPGIEGALWSPREARLDPASLTRAYAAAAARRGARLELGTRVTGLLRDGAHVTGVCTPSGDLAASQVVICSGAWASECETWVGVTLPVEPVRGQMVALETPDPPLRSIVWGPNAYLVPRGRLLRIGATVERVGFDVRCTAGGVSSLLSAASDLIPVLADCRFENAWAGLRPATPDGLPLIGPVPDREGLFVAVGHYRMGILLSGLTALAVADRILAGKTTPGFERFDPARFGS